MEKFIIVSANFCQSVFEKGFLQDVRHNLWRILRRDPVPVRVSSKGCTIRRVEIPSNKLLTTAFEASLECITVM